MKREDLLKIEGLSEEQVNAVMKLHNNDANDWGTKLNAKDTEINTLKGEKTTLENDLAKFKDIDIEALKKAGSDWEEKYNNLMFEKELDVAIAKSNPKNAKALKALLEIKNIKLEDGKLTGLEDQLTALKESDGYLFDEVQNGQINTGGFQGGAGSKNDGVEARFKELNPDLEI